MSDSSATCLDARLRLLGITEDTEYNARRFYPNLVRHLEEIVNRFYKHLVSFPEAEKILKNHDVGGYLKVRQQNHWKKLFWCSLDDDYAKEAIRIGSMHYKCHVPPHLYIAAYNFFHCELIDVATTYCDTPTELARILSATARLISLDMDLALSAYTLAHWRRFSEKPQQSAAR